MQPLSGNQRPDLLTALMNMSLVLRLPRKMHLCRSYSHVPRLPSLFGNATKPSHVAHFWQGPQSLAPATRNDIWTSKSGPNPWCFSHFNFETCFVPQWCALFRQLNFKSAPKLVFHTFWSPHVFRATTACTFSTAQLPKVVREWCSLYILTSKCASRHYGVHFFDISTELVFSTFWLRNVLRLTTACTFSTSQLPKVVRKWGVFSFFTCKCASRHNGVQFFISHLARWLRTRRFSEPTFRPSGATNHCKSTVFPDLPTFSNTCIFFLLTLSLLWSSLFCSSLFLFPLTLPISAFHLSILSEVWLLNSLRF